MSPTPRLTPENDGQDGQKARSATFVSRETSLFSRAALREGLFGLFLPENNRKVSKKRRERRQCSFVRKSGVSPAKAPARHLACLFHVKHSPLSREKATNAVNAETFQTPSTIGGRKRVTQARNAANGRPPIEKMPPLTGTKRPPRHATPPTEVRQ